MIFKARPKTESGYRTLWRRAVRDLWRSFEAKEPIRQGERRRIGRRPRFTLFSWRDEMTRNIRTYLTASWTRGAAEFGIKPNEFTSEERARLETILNQQTNIDYLDSFYRDALSKFREDPRQRPSSMYARADLWVNRWNQTLNESRAVFGRNRKMKWILGETHEHCKTCYGFNGRVYRASTWAENGALPQTHALECQGFNCKCRLEETTERITPGKFPRSLLA